MPSELSRCKCYGSNQANHLLNEIDIPVFQTNTLILQFLQQTAVTLCCIYGLQGLAHTSPQGASGMDKLWHNNIQMLNKPRVHFHLTTEITKMRRGHTSIIPAHWRFCLLLTWRFGFVKGAKGHIGAWKELGEHWWTCHCSDQIILLGRQNWQQVVPKSHDPTVWNQPAVTFCLLVKIVQPQQCVTALFSTQITLHSSSQ